MVDQLFWYSVSKVPTVYWLCKGFIDLEIIFLERKNNTLKKFNHEQFSCANSFLILSLYRVLKQVGRYIMQIIFRWEKLLQLKLVWVPELFKFGFKTNGQRWGAICILFLLFFCLVTFFYKTKNVNKNLIDLNKTYNVKKFFLSTPNIEIIEILRLFWNTCTFSKNFWKVQNFWQIKHLVFICIFYAQSKNLSSCYEKTVSYSNIFDATWCFYIPYVGFHASGIS